MNFSHQHWLEEAIRMANENAANGGAPFAALVVRENRIIGKGVNSDHLSYDPTAHAELLAIRDACQNIRSMDLSDSIVYASGEPCPMCTGAIYWSKPRAVYFACSKSEATDSVNFTDPLQDFFTEMLLQPLERRIPLVKLDIEQRLTPFQTWDRLNG